MKLCHSGGLGQLMGVVCNRTHAWALHTSRNKAVYSCSAWNIFSQGSTRSFKKYIKIITIIGCCIRKSPWILNAAEFGILGMWLIDLSPYKYNSSL